MIFQHTAQWVLDRSPHTGQPKTQTRRPMKDGDHYAYVDGALAVYRHGRLLYQVGKTYSIQPGRGRKGIGHFRLLHIGFVSRAWNMSSTEARAEGFKSPSAFREIWVKLYGRAALEQSCYALVIERIGE